MAHTQENRLIGIETPLGEDVLLLESFEGHEAISRPFCFHLELLSERQDISFGQLIGQNVTIRIELIDRNKRYVNGYVSRFAQSGQDPNFTRYQMEVVPWLWFLTRVADCRIYQNKTIPDIVEEVFRSRGYKHFKRSLTAQYDKRDYCVQYRETDFDFVSRLMEQYGIYYFFEHKSGEHTLVMADSPSAHSTCPHQEVARCDLTKGDLATEDMITDWQLEQELHTGKYSLNDYNFTTPNTNLAASEPTVVNVGGNSNFELYDYPGDYRNTSQGRQVAKVRMQEREAEHMLGKGNSGCRAFLPGYKFQLKDHYLPKVNEEYVLVEVRHSATVRDSYRTGEGAGEEYKNSFSCIPAQTPFRPSRVTPRPFVHGPQTALVVGKSGEEIWVDKYGRVKVQFYWDRVGKKDENSSCWVRVSQAWAGKQWGAMWIPRIGQEVIVDFLEGDPDRPIITGRVYNADQEPPYKLPEHNTRSTFLSRSSKHGAKENFNEIRFEDKKGSEQIFINAERDMDLRVEKVSREYVGKDRHLIVKGDQKEKVDGSLHSHVGSSLNQKVGAGMSLNVGTALNEKTGTTFAHQAGEMIHLKAGMNVVIESGLELTIKAGEAFINLGPAGVAISGPLVLINSGGAAGAGPGSNPEAPEAPEIADDGSKGDKLG